MATPAKISKSNVLHPARATWALRRSAILLDGDFTLESPVPRGCVGGVVSRRLGCIDNKFDVGWQLSAVVFVSDGSDERLDVVRERGTIIIELDYLLMAMANELRYLDRVKSKLIVAVEFVIIAPGLPVMSNHIAMSASWTK